MCARDIGPPGFETRLSPPQPSTLGNRRPAHRQSPHFLAALGFSPRIKTKNYFVPPPSSPSLLLPSVESLSVECKSRSRPSEARWSSESLSSLSLLILSLAIFLVYIRLHASNSRSTPSARAAKMGSSSALRLAILECDTPQPQTRAQFGGYAGVFTALLSSAAKTLSPPQDLSKMVTITAHDVVNDLYCYPALEDVDALLLTGSRHTAFDNDPWILKLVDFTKRALETGRIRVVGICFGHQIVGRAVGAGVGKSDKGWEVAVTEVDLTDKGKEMFGLDKMRIHQMHRDIVQNFPPDAIPLGGNAFCPVQAMYLPGKYITVQGHPEFTNEIISEILFNRHTVGIFTDEVYEDAIKRAPVPHDGVAIGRAFLKFLREG